MSMNAFQKNQQLHVCAIENSLTENSRVEDKAQLLELAKKAVKVAHKHCFAHRFGSFYGDSISAVYVNMGPTNRWVLDRLRAQIEEEGDAALAVAFWPEDGESAGYTFLVIIDSPSHEYWESAAIDIWVKGNSGVV